MVTKSQLNKAVMAVTIIYQVIGIKRFGGSFIRDLQPSKAAKNVYDKLFEYKAFKKYTDNCLGISVKGRKLLDKSNREIVKILDL